MSFSSSLVAAMCSSVLTLTLYLSGATVAATVCVLVLSRYDRPGSIGCSLIQMMVASNWSATSGRASAVDQHVATADVELVGQRERDGLAGDWRPPSGRIR